MDMFLCTPILGKRRRDQSLEIESRVPAAIEDLRRWTSAEALGDVTVPPDCASRILSDTTCDDAVDHKLPSPEEQVQAIALKFPAEIVAVDVSGRGFERMSMRRRSLLSGSETQETTVKRRSRPRRPRGKRRNTIAGTDQKEIRQAIGGETTGDEPGETIPNATPRAHRSASTDILGIAKKDSPTEKKSHFNTLKTWSMFRLKLINPKSSQQQQQQQEESTARSTERSEQAQNQTRSPEEINIYETVTMKRKRDRSHERKPSSSSSSGKSTASIPVSVPSTDNKQPSVKLRDSAAQRRERRKGSSNRDDAPHSSSGNWSASSESGRASIGSETTTTTHQPRSTTTASIGTSSTSLALSHMRRPKGRDTSASSSVTSEGTLTPDIIQDITVMPFSDDGETSSVYSCDTEGYYTSFHMDSGLKTLREEEPMPQSPLTKSNDVGSDPTSPVVENEYELFGRGSTSTTTSSAGTVCTALLAPPPPERKSSLTVVAMVHGQNQTGGESPDSGHNTSSSPVESASSPACTGRSCSEFEYSESSDLEGCERIERIRSKTAITTSRIPSMCVITPPVSDDEHAKDTEQSEKKTSEPRKTDLQSGGSVLMSATVGTSKMEVINGQDKNLYATVQVLPAAAATNNEKPVATMGQSLSIKVGPLSSVLDKLRGVLPGKKHTAKSGVMQEISNADSGDYVTIADVRNNNDKRPAGPPSSSSSSSSGMTAVRPTATYANTDIFKKDAEYVSLSELPKKPDSSLERKRQGARVTLDSEGKVVYSSDSLKRRKGAHTTFNPGPFVREGVSPSPSPLLHRAMPNVRAVAKNSDAVDGPTSVRTSTPPTSPQLGKLIIRAARSPDRAASPDYVRTPATVVGPTSPTSHHRQVRGAYVNVQDDEENLLAIPSEAIPPQSIVQPPPYVAPPKPDDRQKSQKYQEILKDSQQPDLRAHPEKEKQQVTARAQKQDVYDPRQNIEQYDNHRRNLLDQQQISNYEYQQRARSNYQTVHMYNARNQQFCPPPGDVANQQQFYTLPTRRPQREIEPSRSVTPDITRGLARDSYGSMHILAKQGQQRVTIAESDHQDARKKSRAECTEAQGRSVQSQPQSMVDTRNRFATPLNLTALGYRFFASSPASNLVKSPNADALQNNPISPIGHGGYGNGFGSSTPTNHHQGRSAPSVAERLALNPNNCSSPALASSSSGRNTSVQISSGRTTPTNLILSPTKSTMSNEELFAAIHKSKKRLNMKFNDDNENLSPYGSMNSLVKATAGSRYSWSPESQKPLDIPTTVQSPTSRMDFKRLLLQQSVKACPIRLSAAEQLKLSRQQCQQQQQQSSPSAHHQNPLTKVLSPRSVWRFQTPRTDVLSSTIIEDTAAEEKAMKPSPENTSPISRLNSRRQLDLGDHPRVTGNEVKAADNNNDRLTVDKTSANESSFDSTITSLSQNRTRELITSTPNNSTRITSPAKTMTIDQNPLASKIDSAIQYSKSSTEAKKQDPLTALESRRISNQLARAQFLASTPTSTNPTQNLRFTKRFRARSESPQHAVTQNVVAPRSPSAPTLETAL